MDCMNHTVPNISEKAETFAAKETEAVVLCLFKGKEPLENHRTGRDVTDSLLM